MSATPRIVQFDNPEAFAARVTPFLMRREAENCFFLGFIAALGAKTQSMLVGIEDDRDGMIGVAVRSPDRHWMLTNTTVDAADVLVRHLIEQQHVVPGIQADPTIAVRFAERYCVATNVSQRAGSAMAVHVLSAVNPLPFVPGTLRVAKEDDIDLLAEWFERFAIDIGHAGGDRRDVATERIASGTTFLWERDGTPVCTATLSGPTPNGIRISLVYTPPQHRGQGYATATVAELSRRMLEKGRKFCFLYTDLANPTSNKIYRAIGYEKVCEQRQIFFDTRPV